MAGPPMLRERKTWIKGFAKRDAEALAHRWVREVRPTGGKLTVGEKQALKRGV